MHFTISATGTKAEVLTTLETQREPSPDYASLKNQVLEHVASYVQSSDAAEGSSLSVSVHGSVSFSKPVADAAAGV